jgi:hypothetical protein
VEIITLLVRETKRHYNSHPDRTDDRPSSMPDMTVAEMLVSSITVQIGHCIWDRQTDRILGK